MLHAVTLFAKQNVEAISELYIDLPNDGSTTVFGERRPDLPGCKYITRPGFQTDPWVRGVVPYPPQAGVAELLEQYFISAPDSELAGNFLVHEEPRFIRITGFVIRDQLVGNNLIGHELMSMLLRRFAQLGCQAETENPYLSWRHPIEPEFSTLVLSDCDFLHTVSIQKQLSAESLKYDITSSQMFITPVPRPEEWMVIAWDMQVKVINVIDPLYAKSSPTLPYKDRDKALAWKLHNAFFACLHEFYAGWPSDKDNWLMKHEPTTDVIFMAVQSGASALHIARHFDGEKLKLPLTQHNASKTKKDALHECLKLQGNFSAQAHKALWKVSAPSDSAFND